MFDFVLPWLNLRLFKAGLLWSPQELCKILLWFTVVITVARPANRLECRKCKERLVSVNIYVFVPIKNSS